VDIRGISTVLIWTNALNCGFVVVDR